MPCERAPLPPLSGLSLRRILATGLATILAVGLSGCGLIDANIFDIDVHLETQKYAHDFGATMGMVPRVPCSAQADTCAEVTKAVMDNRVSARCDTDKSLCYAVADLTLSYTVNLATDPAFQSSVNQKAIQAVRTIDLAYGMPTNTLTIDIPEIEVYVGPQNAMSKTDPKVLLIGKIGPFTRGQQVPDRSRHLIVADGTPARAQLVANIMTPKVPFVFLLSTTPRVDAGDPLPAGAMELHVAPTLTVGIPR